MSERRLLLIAYHFDPDNEIGGVRPRAYARYLPALGWELLVVTAGDPRDDTSSRALTVRHVVPGSTISSVKRRFGVMAPIADGADNVPTGRPDPGTSRPGSVAQEIAGVIPEKVAWGLRAAARTVAVGRRWHPDVILSSAPTHVVNLVAWHASGSLDVPWVAELRDLWGRNPFRTGTRLRRLPDVALERMALRRAAAVVTVSEPLAEALRKDHPGTSVFSIVTGVDEDLVAPPDVQLDEHFCLFYAGRLYLGHRDLATILVPLRMAIDRGLVAAAHVRLHVLLLEALPRETEELIDRLGLRSIVEVEYRVPRDEVIGRQRRAQILLHLRWDAAPEAGIMTGKIFEYLAARRPILSTGRYRDVAVELLEATGAGHGTTDDEQVVAFLGDAFAEWRALGRVPFAGREETLRRADLRGMAAAMDDVLRGATASRPP